MWVGAPASQSNAPDERDKVRPHALRGPVGSVFTSRSSGGLAMISLDPRPAQDELVSFMPRLLGFFHLNLPCCRMQPQG